MLKCHQCQTLYSESATHCLYCKIPIKVAEVNDLQHDFLLFQGKSQKEAESCRIDLAGKGVACTIKDDENLAGFFQVWIASNDKKSAFSMGDSLTFGVSDKQAPRKKNRSMMVIMYFILIVLAFACLYYMQKMKSSFFSSATKENIIYEGTVDPRIAHPSHLENKKKSQSKKENGRKP